MEEQDEVHSLLEVCLQVVLDNIHALGPVGQIADELFIRIINHAGPEKLSELQDYNADVSEDVYLQFELCWKKYCITKLHLAADQEDTLMDQHGAQSWRELYEAIMIAREQKRHDFGKKLKERYQQLDQEKQSHMSKQCGIISTKGRRRRVVHSGGVTRVIAKQPSFKGKLMSKSFQELKSNSSDIAARKGVIPGQGQSTPRPHQPPPPSSSSTTSSKHLKTPTTPTLLPRPTSTPSRTPSALSSSSLTPRSFSSIPRLPSSNVSPALQSKPNVVLSRQSTSTPKPSAAPPPPPPPSRHLSLPRIPSKVKSSPPLPNDSPIVPISHDPHPTPMSTSLSVRDQVTRTLTPPSHRPQHTMSTPTNNFLTHRNQTTTPVRSQCPPDPSLHHETHPPLPLQKVSSTTSTSRRLSSDTLLSGAKTKIAVGTTNSPHLSNNRTAAISLSPDKGEVKLREGGLTQSKNSSQGSHRLQGSANMGAGAASNKHLMDDEVVVTSHQVKRNRTSV